MEILEINDNSYNDERISYIPINRINGVEMVCNSFGIKVYVLAGGRYFTHEYDHFSDKQAAQAAKDLVKSILDRMNQLK